MLKALQWAPFIPLSHKDGGGYGQRCRMYGEYILSILGLYTEYNQLQQSAVPLSGWKDGGVYIIYMECIYIEKMQNIFSIHIEK